MIWRTITINYPQCWLKLILTQYDADLSNWRLHILLQGCSNDAAVSWEDAAAHVRHNVDCFSTFVTKGHRWPLVFLCSVQNKATYWSGHVLVIVQVFFCLSVSPLNQPYKGHSPYSTNTVLMRNVLNFQGPEHLKHSYISLMWTGW